MYVLLLYCYSSIKSSLLQRSVVFSFVEGNVKTKNIELFLLKIFIFYNFKNHCVLHGHVFTMFMYQYSSLICNENIFVVV